jgi:tRNA (guanine-N7-)-methyltransferase
MRHSDRMRRVRSFVLREGRITRGQSAALQDLWPAHGVTLESLNTDPSRVFQRRAPLHVEIGIGDGENLIAMAADAPDNNYLGCEVHRPGLGHALLRLRDTRLHNVRLVETDAVELISTMPPGAIDVIYIFFPDPWPKKRHHKRRLVQAPVLDLLAHVLKRSGRLYFATDNADYAESVLDVIDGSPRWLNLAGPRSFALRPRCRLITRFEQRALDDERRIYELTLATASGGAR